MNFATYIGYHESIEAGGSGSGCNPDKVKCGRPATGAQKMPRGRMQLERIDQELRTAAGNKTLVVMEYKSPSQDDAETKTYKVEPYSYRNDGKTFFGYDTVAKSIKAFNMLGIIRVQQTEEKYKPRWSVELGQKEEKKTA